MSTPQRPSSAVEYKHNTPDIPRSSIRPLSALLARSANANRVGLQLSHHTRRSSTPSFEEISTVAEKTENRIDDNAVKPMMRVHRSRPASAISYRQNQNSHILPVKQGNQHPELTRKAPDTPMVSQSPRNISISRSSRPSSAVSTRAPQYDTNVNTLAVTQPSLTLSRPSSAHRSLKTAHNDPMVTCNSSHTSTTTTRILRRLSTSTSASTSASANVKAANPRTHTASTDSLLTLSEDTAIPACFVENISSDSGGEDEGGDDEDDCAEEEKGGWGEDGTRNVQQVRRNRGGKKGKNKTRVGESDRVWNVTAQSVYPTTGLATTNGDDCNSRVDNVDKHDDNLYNPATSPASTTFHVNFLPSLAPTPPSSSVSSSSSSSSSTEVAATLISSSSLSSSGSIPPPPHPIPSVPLPPPSPMLTSVSPHPWPRASIPATVVDNATYVSPAPVFHSMRERCDKHKMEDGRDYRTGGIQRGNENQDEREPSGEDRRLATDTDKTKHIEKNHEVGKFTNSVSGKRFFPEAPQNSLDVEIDVDGSGRLEPLRVHTDEKTVVASILTSLDTTSTTAVDDSWPVGVSADISTQQRQKKENDIHLIGKCVALTEMIKEVKSLQHTLHNQHMHAHANSSLCSSSASTSASACAPSHSSPSAVSAHTGIAASIPHTTTLSTISSPSPSTTSTTASSSSSPPSTSLLCSTSALTHALTDPLSAAQLSSLTRTLTSCLPSLPHTAATALVAISGNFVPIQLGKGKLSGFPEFSKNNLDGSSGADSGDGKGAHKAPWSRRVLQCVRARVCGSATDTNNTTTTNTSTAIVAAPAQPSQSTTKAGGPAAVVESETGDGLFPWPLSAVEVCDGDVWEVKRAIEGAGKKETEMIITELMGILKKFREKVLSSENSLEKMREVVADARNESRKNEDAAKKMEVRLRELGKKNSQLTSEKHDLQRAISSLQEQLAACEHKLHTQTIIQANDTLLAAAQASVVSACAGERGRQAMLREAREREEQARGWGVRVEETEVERDVSVAMCVELMGRLEQFGVNMEEFWEKRDSGKSTGGKSGHIADISKEALRKYTGILRRELGKRFSTWERNDHLDIRQSAGKKSLPTGNSQFYSGSSLVPRSSPHQRLYQTLTAAGAAAAAAAATSAHVSTGTSSGGSGGGVSIGPGLRVGIGSEKTVRFASVLPSESPATTSTGSHRNVVSTISATANATTAPSMLL